MRKKIWLFFLFLLPILSFGKLKFESQALDNAGNFLFRSWEDGINTDEIPESSLFYGNFQGKEPEVQMLSFRPEHAVYNRDTENVFLQNRFGVFLYDQKHDTIKALKNFPSFISGEEYSIYDLCKIAPSPNGRYLLYKKAVSPTRADLFLYDLTTFNSVLLISSTDRCPGEDVAKWSADSQYFIYQKNGKIFYFSMNNYLTGQQLEESWCFLANVCLKNGAWTAENRFIWAKDEAIWESDPTTFVSKSIYSSYLQQGQVIAQLPYPFHQQSHRFFYFPESGCILLSRDNGAVMLFNPGKTLEENVYLPMDTTMRLQKAVLNENGNGAILVKILQNGKFIRRIFLIQGKSFHSLPDNLYPEILDISISGNSLLIAYSNGAVALDLNSNKELWQMQQEAIRSLLPMQENCLLFGHEAAWLKNSSGDFQPLFLCSAPNAGLSENTPVITRNNSRFWKINPDSGKIEQRLTSPGKITVKPQSSRGRLIIREIKKSFYHDIVCIKDPVSGQQIDIIKEAKLNYTLYQPEIRGDLRFKTGEKYEIALLFDCIRTSDGVFEIIEALKRYNIRANFFLNGDFIRNAPALTREISLLDAEIGNLFDSNINFSGENYTIDKTFVQQGLSRAEENYFALTGKNFAPYWHSPRFIYNTSIIQYGLDAGYRFASYQLDSMDWIDQNDRQVNSRYYMNNEGLILRLMKNLKPSQTVLFSTGINGIQRDEWLFYDISTILCEMQRSGYTFSYVSSILNRYRKE